MKENQSTFKIQDSRITWVDVMKSLLIISMVIGHSTSPLVTYIYLFHMPAFFVLSGYTYRGEKYKLGQFVWKKASTILFPTILINIVYIIFYVIMQASGLYTLISAGESLSLTERILGLFLRLQTTDFGGATWFLFVLFEVEILIKVLEVVLQKLKINKLLCCLAIAVGCIGYLLVIKQKILPYYLDLAFMACLYFGIGMVFAKTSLLDKLEEKVMIPLCLIATIFWGSFYFGGSIPMNWPTRDFSNLFIQLISCFAIFYLVWCIAVYADKTRIGKYLRWLGTHTYCVLITHFVIFRSLFAIGASVGILSFEQVQQLTPDAVTAANGGWVIISIATVALCSLIAWIAEKNILTDYIFNARISHRR